MSLDSDVLKIIDNKIYQISVGKISFEELESLKEMIQTPNLLLSTKTGLKCWLALGYINLGLNEKFLLIIHEIISETSSDGVEAFKIIKNIEYVLDYFGQYLMNLQEYELALKTFRLALDQAKLESDTNVIASISKHLAYSYFYLKDYDKSSRLLEIASSIFTNAQETFSCLILSAKLKYKQNDLIKSITLLESALRISKKLNNNDLINQTQKKLLDLQREILIKGNIKEDEKIFFYMESITQNLKSSNQDSDLASAYYEFGMILEKKGYLDESILYYEEASRISYDNELWPLYGRVSLQLGIIAFNQQDYEIANSYADQVLQISSYDDDSDLENLGLKLKSAINKTKSSLHSYNKDTKKTTEVEPSQIQISTPNVNPEPEIIDQPLPSNTIEEAEITNIQPEVNSNVVSLENDSNSSNFTANLEFDSINNHLEQTGYELSSETSDQNLEQQSNQSSGLTFETSFENTRHKISEFLTKNGFTVEFDLTPYNGTSSIDIVASKGNIRKKKMYILISGNEGEASLAGYLFNSLLQSGKKIIFLESGNPSSAVLPKDVQIITNIEEIPLNL